MSKHITHAAYILSVRKRVVDTARSMLDGKLSFLEGARLLSSLRHEADVRGDDADFLTFVVIDSETDALPIGMVRQFWSQHALENLATEIVEAELWAKELGGLACESLVRRFDV